MFPLRFTHNSNFMIGTLYTLIPLNTNFHLELQFYQRTKIINYLCSYYCFCKPVIPTTIPLRQFASRDLMKSARLTSGGHTGYLRPSPIPSSREAHSPTAPTGRGQIHNPSLPRVSESDHSH